MGKGNGLVEIMVDKIGGFRKKRMLGVASMVSWIMVLLGLLFPIVNTEASAEEIRDSSVHLTPTLGVSLSGMSVWEVDPSLDDGVATTNTDLVISSTGSAGYKVYLSAMEGNTSLTNIDAAIDAKIESITDMTALSDFSENTWGYSLTEDGSTNKLLYASVPESMDDAVLEKVAGADTLDRYDLSFAVKVDTALPAGAYVGRVVVSVVATPFEIHTLSDLTYMQEMSPYVCDYSDEHETKQLIDTRDGKSYWVAKLKDGNCWMTQNLALDLDVNEQGNAVAVSKDGKQTELNSENTDIDAMWNQNTPLRTTEGLPSPGTVVQAGSWNLGNIVLKMPTQASGCPQATIPEDGYIYPNADKYNSVFHGQNLSENCNDAYVDVTGWDDTFMSTITSSVDIESKQYDAHYLIGNYYQFSTATAGSGENLYAPDEAETNPDKLVNAPESICPANWQLPTGGGNMIGQWPFNLDKSYYRLLYAYGYPETGDSSTGNAGILGWNANSGFGFTSLTGNGITRLDYDSTYFVRSGFISLNSGSLRFANTRGNYYSMTPVAGSIDAIFGLGFESTIVYPSGSIGRAWGSSVRCLAK